MNLENVYSANLENEEMQAYIALYRCLFESQEDKWDIWEIHAKSLSVKDRLKMQKRFEIFAKSDLFTTLNRVVLKRDSLKIVAQARSFAIDYCKKNADFPYDFVD